MPMIRKLYRERVVSKWEIIEKETSDEIIFRTVKVRNRLILELMARGGMRIGEVLKLRVFLTSGSLESKITYYPSNREKSAFCTNYDNYTDTI